MKLTNKGQAGTVITLIIVMVTIVVCALILQSLDTALAGTVTTAPYNVSWVAVADNAVTGMSLTTLLPILLGAGALIMAVYGFAKR
jgi:hypothetical protein